MDFVSNPFKPGAGRVPLVLAGRGELLNESRTRLYQARETGEGERPWILSGLRGVGKIVLLNQLGREASELGLVFIKVEASSSKPLAVALAKELHLALRRVLSTSDRARVLWSRAARVLRSFQVCVDPSGSYSFTFDIEPERGVADSGDLAVDLQELLESIGLTAREANTVLLLAVDELQEASPEDLAALNVALHNLGQDVFPVPVVFVGAGLPSLPALLAHATSYAERLYDYRRIGLLDTASTGDALTSPAHANGVEWATDALDAAVTATGGYPYFIQACGSHVWSVRASDIITLDDAQIGIDAARTEVEQGLYQSRWQRAIPTQRAFLSAMAIDDDTPSPMAELVTRLQKKRTTDLSVNRRGRAQPSPLSQLILAPTLCLGIQAATDVQLGCSPAWRHGSPPQSVELGSTVIRDRLTDQGKVATCQVSLLCGTTRRAGRRHQLESRDKSGETVSSERLAEPTTAASPLIAGATVTPEGLKLRANQASQQNELCF